MFNTTSSVMKLNNLAFLQRMWCLLFSGELYFH